MKNNTNIQSCSSILIGLIFCVFSFSSYAGNISLLGESNNVSIPFNSNFGNALSVDVEKSWWHQHYVTGLGLAPFSTGIKAVPFLENQRSSGPLLGYDKNKPNLTIKPDAIKGKIYYPLSDVIPARTDGGEYLSGYQYLPLIFFRIQDNLNSKPFDAQPGSIVWTNDREAANESMMINAALLMDMYFPGVGSGNRNLFGFSSDNMFHLLIGAELNRFDSGGAAAEVDIRRYSALMEFSPGALLNLPTVGGEAGKARQTMTLGWVFEDDVIQDAQRHSIQLRYAPLFNLLSDKLHMFVGARSYYKKFFDFYSEEEVSKELQKANDAKIAISGLSSAVVQADKANAAVATGDQPFNSYFYLRPKVGLDYGQVSSSSVLKGEIPDLTLNYLIETGLSFNKETFQIGYRLNGVTGIGKSGTHVIHELFAQVTPHGWPGKLFCTYKRGELAPSFVDVDLLQIGLGVKF